MVIWAVGMVKDEADIIESTIRQLFEQGVDHIMVADNMSTDRTSDILRQFDNLTLKWDGDVRFYQGQKISAMVREACFAGADWVIPFDGDESWTFDRLLLERLPSAIRSVKVSVQDYIQHEGNWERMETAGPHKVIVRALPAMRVGQGNHSCSMAGQADGLPGFGIKHYPYRNEEQFVRKCRNLAAGYAATTLPKNWTGDWIRYASMTDDEIRAIWKEDRLICQQ